MNELQQELFEKQLVSLVKRLDYPRTPDIAVPVMKRLRASSSPPGRGRPEGSGEVRFVSRKLAWSLTALLILFLSLMLIPPARAAIIEFIQIGVVRIFRAEPTPLPPLTASPSITTPLTATPVATSQSLIPMLEKIAGETTLEGAQKAVNYPILVPSYPPNLGKPDRVFVQDAGAMTVLVWLDHQHPDKVLMSLHFLPPGSWAIKKIEPTVIKETTVNGHRAIWATGPYPIIFSNGNMDLIRLVNGHVLIWADDGITYRLESDFRLDEAVKMAESLKPLR